MPWKTGLKWVKWLSKLQPISQNVQDFTTVFNPISANPTKCSYTLKQFVGNLPTNCLSVVDHFVGMALS